MTKQEYAEYEASVAAFFEREGIQNLSADCDSEPSFSWRSCDCCGSHLGGDRENASGYNPKTKEIQTYEVCMDCVYYAEYGQLDDMTMQDMDRETEAKSKADALEAAWLADNKRAEGMAEEVRRARPEF